MIAPTRPNAPPLERAALLALRTVRNRTRRRVDNVRHHLALYREDVVVAPGSYIGPDVVIGRGTRINEASYLEPCTIGRYCAIAGRLVVRSANHHMQFLNIEEDLQRRMIGAASVLGPREPVTIGNAVWFGDSVVIAPSGLAMVSAAPGSESPESVPPAAQPVSTIAVAMPTATSTGHIKSASWAAANNIPSETRGAARLAASPSAKWPMNIVR